MDVGRYAYVRSRQSLEKSKSLSPRIERALSAKSDIQIVDGRDA
jgi:hypothetical protein